MADASDEQGKAAKTGGTKPDVTPPTGEQSVQDRQTEKSGGLPDGVTEDPSQQPT